MSHKRYLHSISLTEDQENKLNRVKEQSKPDRLSLVKILMATVEAMLIPPDTMHESPTEAIETVASQTESIETVEEE